MRSKNNCGNGEAVFGKVSILSETLCGQQTRGLPSRDIHVSWGRAANTSSESFVSWFELSDLLTHVCLKVSTCSIITCTSPLGTFKGPDGMLVSRKQSTQSHSGINGETHKTLRDVRPSKVLLFNQDIEL
jgi:hypothetical protein